MVRQAWLDDQTMKRHQSTERVTPTSVGQLELGALYQITGKGTDLELLPTQVFRLESMSTTFASGSVTLTGTLWWRIWVGGRWFSGKQKPHSLMTHHVGIGKGLTGKHDFHFEKVDRERVKEVLGEGRAYGDYLQDVAKNEVRQLRGSVAV